MRVGPARCRRAHFGLPGEEHIIEPRSAGYGGMVRRCGGESGPSAIVGRPLTRARGLRGPGEDEAGDGFRLLQPCRHCGWVQLRCRTQSFRNHPSGGTRAQCRDSAPTQPPRNGRGRATAPGGTTVRAHPQRVQAESGPEPTGANNGSCGGTTTLWGPGLHRAAPPTAALPDGHLFFLMSQPYVISISSDEDDDEIEVLEFNKHTQQLIEQPAPKVVKRLSEAECPICFDAITTATATFCGHVFCLECLQRSIASSSARGQTRGRKGVGLCPMCRKTVAFKDATVLRLKTGMEVRPPVGELGESEGGDGGESDLDETLGGLF